MANSLRFTVEVAADQATKSLNALSAAFNEAGIESRTSLLKIGPAANEARKEIGGLGSHVKELKGEMASSMRAANFFAKGLNDIMPASSLAGEGIRLLISGLIGGAGLGLAIEAAIAAVKLFTEHHKEIEEQAKKVRAALDEEAQAFLKLRDIQAQTNALGLPEGRERALDENARKAQKEWNDIYAEQAKAERELAQLKKDKAPADQQLAVIGRIMNLEDARGALRGKEEADAARIGAQYDLKEIKAEDALRLQAAYTDGQRIEIGYQNTVREAEFAFTNALMDEIEYDHEINKALQTKKDLVEAIANRQEAARFLAPKKSLEEIDAGLGADYSLSGRGADELARQRAYDRHAPNPNAPSYAGSASEQADSYSQVEIDMAGTKDAHLAASEAAKQHAKEVKDAAEAYREMGAVGGAAVAGLVTGQTTLMGVMKQVLTVAVKQIFTAAAVASANSAETGALAGGPFGAAASMAATQALVLGLIASLPSAAGGLQVPRGMNPIVQLHSGEHVIPERIARNYEKGGGGAPSFTLNATYVDRPGFDRLTRDVTREQRRLNRQRRTA